MSPLLAQLLAILALILLNGVLAMAEIAIVASRRARLEDMAARGHRGASIALQLASDPNRFLSTVQIGITLVGVLAGALGGLMLADDVAHWLDELLGPGAFHRPMAVGVVVVSTTYLSLVVGELVPKRLALSHAEKLAVVLAPLMRLLAKATAPAVWLLGVSTNLALRLLRVKGNSRQLTEEEIRLMLAEGAASGIFHQAEHTIVENVFRFADRSVAELMTPRSDVVWLDINEPIPGAVGEGHRERPVPLPRGQRRPPERDRDRRHHRHRPRRLGRPPCAPGFASRSSSPRPRPPSASPSCSARRAPASPWSSASTARCRGWSP